MDERPIDDGSDIEPLPDEILAELRAVPVDELARERAIIAALAEAPRTTRRAASPLPLAGAAAAVVLLAGGASPPSRPHVRSMTRPPRRSPPPPRSSMPRRRSPRPWTRCSPPKPTTS